MKTQPTNREKERMDACPNVLPPSLCVKLLKTKITGERNSPGRPHACTLTLSHRHTHTYRATNVLLPFGSKKEMVLIWQRGAGDGRRGGDDLSAAQISTFVSFLYLLSTKTHAHRISLSVRLPPSCRGDRRGHLDECVPLWDMCSDLRLEAKRLNIQSAHIVAEAFWNQES